MAIYLVTVQTDPAQTRLVDAPTKNTAVNHVIKGLVSAQSLSASEVVQHMQAGIQVEKAGEDLSEHKDAKVTRSEDVKAMDAPAE